MTANYDGLIFGTWRVVRELPRDGYIRKVECACTKCAARSVKHLTNLKSKNPGCDDCAWRELTQADEFGRLCSTCGLRKSWDEFQNDARKKRSGKASNCRDCAAWASIKSRYGVTKAEWHWLADKQNNACALCFESCNLGRLSIDHDHSCCSGSCRACKKCIRGLLCRNCNQMLGYAEKREALRALFAVYLNGRPFA